MKKKFISFCTILCLIFPCFFAVSCKNKPGLDKVEAYTYSVTLKNAKGKIDESTLLGEYDYVSEQKVAWQESDGNYTISVTRTSKLSGSAVVSLLEGYDYSNLSLLVNNKTAEFSIKSGTNTDCADEAYLADRQFFYEYSDMKEDTSVVVDFSNCATAIVSLDVSNLKANGVKYYIVDDDFVTLEQAQEIANNEFITISEDSISVDYGSIIAFDYSEQLVLNNDNFTKPQKFEYSTYGSRYFTASNRVQYLNAQRSGSCEVYSVISDASKDGTLRVLASSGLYFANSLDELENSYYDTTTQEFEYYDGEMLTLAVYSADTTFIELNESAQKFNYYLVSKLDEVLSSSNIVTKKNIADSERVYLELDLSDRNGNLNSAKYLVRKPIKNSDYFVVYASSMRENTRFVNADAIVIGVGNKPSSIPASVTDSVLYYFENDTSVQVNIPSILADKKSDGGQIINTISVNAGNINLSTGSVQRIIDPVSVNPNDYTSLSVDCYSVTDSSLYRFAFSYSIKNFEETTFMVSTEELNLYDGENVYYSTTPQIASSWSKLNTNLTLELKSGESESLYYYIDSEREDAGLLINNVLGEKISETNRFHDCFGRTLNGSVEIDGKVINLADIKYLEIVSGYYEYNLKTASIVRTFDETYHSLNTENVEGVGIMISLNGYKDASEFRQLEELDSLKIKYSALNDNAEIYYYVNSGINYYLILKDEEGNVVSSRALIYNNGVVESIYNKYVYSLILNGSYYDENEEFTLEAVEVNYNLYDENNTKLEVYTTNDRSYKTDELYNKISYFLTCEDGYRLDIYDKNGIKIIDWTTFIEISNIENNQKLYLFTFEFPEYENYEEGSKFFVVKSEI